VRRLRAWLDRPIEDTRRGPAFALAAFLIALALAALLLTRQHPPTSHATPDPRPVVAAPKPRPAAAPRAHPEPAEVEGGRLPLGALPRPAARVARRFLSAYLRRLYGQSPRLQLPGAAPKLRRRLTHERVRPVPAARHRHARVVELRARHGAHKLVATGLVDDGGVARYPIELTLEQRRGRWLVTGLGAD
jgi:hypothetical protein